MNENIVDPDQLASDLDLHWFLHLLFYIFMKYVIQNLFILRVSFSLIILTFEVLNQDLSSFENTTDPDQRASVEPGSTLLSTMKMQAYNRKAAGLWDKKYGGNEVNKNIQQVKV